jgi:rare lipoprotein A
MTATPSRRGLLALVPALASLAPTPSSAGEPQRGQAAVYDARRFTGRRMANGRPFDPDHPNGRRTTVVISDRGPFTPGRIIDLSPRSAREIGMNGGVAPVEVRPIARAD